MKSEKQEKDTIIPLFYNTYNRLWSRTCFIARLREADKLRPYAIRGAPATDWMVSLKPQDSALL